VIADAFGGLRDGRAPLGVTAGPDALAELRAIAGRLRADSAGLHGPGALTPGDTCPDNNVETPELWTWPSIAMYLEMAGWRFDRPGRGAHGSAAPAETPPRR